MGRSLTGNNSFLKELNQKTVLELTRVNKAVTKADLSKLTGLSATAVGMIVGSLLEKGYVHETGTGESKGGRKPVMLELKPKSYYSVGVDVDVGMMDIVLIDITSQVIAAQRIEIAGEISVEKASETIGVHIKNLLKKHFIKHDKLLGIGVSVPGLVKSGTHEIAFAPNMGWSSVRLDKLLGTIVKSQVYVENEAMASAIYENWIGSCKSINNFVCINIKSGIGSGIFAGGRLYRGAGGSAGEIGHVTVDENGPKCACGNYGCLETMASVKYLEEKAKRLIRQGTASSLNNIASADDLDLDAIVLAAVDGDQAARGILMESARYLGIAISNIVNTLNPSKVVIGKEFAKYSEIVMEELKAVVAAKALKYPSQMVQIETSAEASLSSALGAAIIPLKILFGKE